MPTKKKLEHNKTRSSTVNGYGKHILLVLAGGITVFMLNTVLGSFVKKDEIHQISLDLVVIKEHMKSMDEKLVIASSNQIKNVEQDQRLSNIESYMSEKWKMDFQLPGVKSQR